MCLCLLALSPLSGRRTWVTKSPSPGVSLKEDGEHDRFKLLLLFQCTQTDLSSNPWVHVHWVFPPAVSSDWEHSTDALPLRTSMWSHDSVLTLSLKPCLVSLLLTSMAHFQNPPCGRPSWVRSVFSCLFMIWFTLTYLHILFGCSVSFTGLK